MNFRELADTFHAPTCIISVEKKPDEKYGEICLVAGNQKYLEPIEHPVYNLATGETVRGENTFIPDLPYETYLPKDIGFEDICYRAAIQKTPIHTYVHLNHINMWFDIFVMPLDYEKDNRCYCTYTANPCTSDDVSLSSGDSGRAYEDVLKTCIKLHETNDMKKIMQEVVQDIRFICRADACSILLQNVQDGTFSELTTSFDENASIKRASQFVNFDEITASWADSMRERDCLILKNEKDIENIKQDNLLWYHVLKESGVSSVILFPLRYEHEILGFLWATNFDIQNIIPIKETLELTTFFIAAQLESYKMMERLRHISYTDRLTGLPNRFACHEFIKDLIQQGNPFTMVSIDINNFKSINSTMGLDAGNEVLTAIASRWKAIADSGNSGTKDYITRISGDEFALVIQNYQSDEELLQTIKQYEDALNRRMTIDECDFYITASFGYVSFPDEAKDKDSVMSYATVAMREVKRANSSNHIIHFTPDLLKTERILEIESGLHLKMILSISIYSRSMI